jgi:hypothetical protein
MRTAEIKKTCKDLEIETNVLYSCQIDSLTVNVGGVPIDVTDTMKNGRTNYQITENIVCKFFNLNKGIGVDLVDYAGNKYEIKAFLDSDAYPGDGKREDRIHTAASSAFKANNNGPTISRLVKNDNYGEALSICDKLSYNKIDYFIYTNTRQFKASQPLKIMFFEKEYVMDRLDPEDPRLISRRTLLNSCTGTVHLSLD